MSGLRFAPSDLRTPLAALRFQVSDNRVPICGGKNNYLSLFRHRMAYHISSLPDDDISPDILDDASCRSGLQRETYHA